MWSYGIVLYELFSRGKMPYAGWTNKETMDHLNKGERLARPEDCPIEVYELMLKCWNKETTERPLFEAISEDINKIMLKFNVTVRKEKKLDLNNNNDITDNVNEDLYN